MNEPGGAKDLSRMMPHDLRERLSASGKPLSVAAGQVVITSGSEERDIYLVREGTMRTALFASSGREVVIRDIPAGELFGELAALDGRPRASTVVAATAAQLLIIPQSAFLAAMEDGGEAALWMLRRFSGMVRLLTEKIFELSALPVRSRLHCELLRLAEEGVHTAEGVLISPAPTHAELAARVGSHREMVTREFGYMTEMGVLRQSGRRLTLLNLHLLMHEIQRVAGSGVGSDLRPVLA
jgi:CRP/FNR family transcriptional regulator, cyclic AMP receptor protein